MRVQRAAVFLFADKDTMIREHLTCSICTHNETGSAKGLNEFWILDDAGEKILEVFSDYRIECVAKYIMGIVCYLGNSIGRHKAGTKVEVFVWPHGQEKLTTVGE